MSKHTPGPWKVVHISQPNGHADVPGVISESGICLSSNVTCENACLIAAAPEMLEALKKAAASLESARKHVGDLHLVGSLLLVKAAIAKAEGSK